MACAGCELLDFSAFGGLGAFAGFFAFAGAAPAFAGLPAFFPSGRLLLEAGFRAAFEGLAGRGLFAVVLGEDFGFLLGRLVELEGRLGDLATAFLIGLGIPELNGSPPPHPPCAPARAAEKKA